MAKLKPIDFNFKAKTGEVLAFRSEVTVSDATGAFALTIPDELENVALKMARNSKFEVAVDRPRTYLRVEGSSLQHCKDFINAVCADYLQCEIVEELVLLYNTNIKVAYIKDDEGNFYTNGYGCREKFDKRQASFHGTLHATNTSDFYQVGIAARIFNKITYKRESGELVEYKWVNDGALENDSWGAKLNSFIGLSFPIYKQQEMARLPQMPYTEQAAEFFYGLLISMCALADRVDSFMGDHDRVLAAIQNHAGLLPASNKDAQ